MAKTPQEVMYEVRSNHIRSHAVYHNHFSKLIIYTILNSESITAYQPITKIFKFSFSPCNIGESNKLQIRNSSNHVYINYLLSFIRPSAALIQNIYNPLRLKLLTRLKLELNHLNKHIFNHNFKNCINSLRSCSLKVVSVGIIYIHNLQAIFKDISKLSSNFRTHVLPFGDSKYSDYISYCNSFLNYIVNQQLLIYETQNVLVFLGFFIMGHIELNHFETPILLLQIFIFFHLTFIICRQYVSSIRHFAQCYWSFNTFILSFAVFSCEQSCCYLFFQ